MSAGAPSSTAARLAAGAIERDLHEPGTPLTPEIAFRIVRDLPYARPSERTAHGAIAEWRGTCSTKHVLLRAVLAELGVPAMLLACTHEISRESFPWLPAELHALVDPPVPDVHNFLRVLHRAPDEEGAAWYTVDATWPLTLGSHGAPVNRTLDRGRDHVLACDPIEVFHVPDDVDPAALKARLLETHARGQLDRRERLIDALSAWAQALPGGADRGTGGS